MTLRSDIRPLTVFVFLVPALLLTAQAQKKGATLPPAPEWRKSVEKFREQVGAYMQAAKGEKTVPQTSSKFLSEGGSVPQEWEVMRKFNGAVEWEGTFKSLEAGPTDRPKKLGMDLYVASHVYPLPAAIPQWEKIAAGTRIRFKATIEGITAIPGSAGGIPMVSLKDAVPLPVN